MLGLVADQLGHADDAAQGVAQVMGHGLVDGAQLLVGRLQQGRAVGDAVFERILQALQLGFGQLAAGDVGQQHHHARWRVVPGRHATGCGNQPQRPAARAAQLQFAAAALAYCREQQGIKGLTLRGLHASPQTRRRHGRRQRLAGDGQAQELGGAGVQVDDGARTVELQDALFGGLDDGAKARFTVAQLLGQLAPLHGVAHGAQQVGAVGVVLAQIVVGTVAQGVQGLALVGVAGEDHHRGSR